LEVIIPVIWKWHLVEEFIVVKTMDYEWHVICYLMDVFNLIKLQRYLEFGGKQNIFYTLA